MNTLKQNRQPRLGQNEGEYCGSIGATMTCMRGGVSHTGKRHTYIGLTGTDIERAEEYGRKIHLRGVWGSILLQPSFSLRIRPFLELEILGSKVSSVSALIA